MIRNSILNKISAIFFLSLFLLAMFFALLLEHQSDKNLENMKQRQIQSVNYLLVMYRNNVQPGDIEEYFNNFGLKKVSSKHLRDSVLANGVVIFQKLSPISRFSSIIYNDRYYLFIDNFESSVLLESQDYKNFNESLWVVFVIALLILLYMYVSIFKSIAPLKTLSSQIRKFACGDLEIECKSDSNDEIGEVANEFDRAVKKIHDLINSRQLFLRTIMHELKTPIGKGRIVAEMLEDATAKKRLVGVFGRLDLLISEFSKIEQITSKRYDLTLKEYSLMHVIDQAVDLLMLDEQKKEEFVKIEGDFDFKVIVDFDLMALALKNLMDNAMKHSLAHTVYVKSKDQTIIIANQGEPLKMAIEEYFQPFVSGSKACGSGLGLGLYIVKNIIAQHGLEVVYSYEEGFHQFSIDFAKRMRGMMRGLEKFNKLVEAFEKLPTVGRKSAVRFAYHLVLNDTFSAMKLANAIESAIKSIRKCERCGALSEHEICDICLDERRDIQKLCLVESAKDIFVLEEHKLFDGRYFVLADLEEETLEKLESIVTEGVKEVIFALTPSLASDALILFIEDKLKNYSLHFTKIAQGVPTGVHLENVDMLSLSKALESRTKI